MTESLGGIYQIINAAALALALCLLHETLSNRNSKWASLATQLVTGLIAGVLGIVVMANPWVTESGYIFDTRSILLILTGVFFGRVPTVVAMTIMVSYLVTASGAGAVSGAVAIGASGLLGLYWRHKRKGSLDSLGFHELFFLGLVGQVVTTIILVVPPNPVPVEILVQIGLPHMVLPPLATAMIGQLMTYRQQRFSVGTELRESQERFSLAMEATSDGLWDWDIEKKEMYCSPGFYRMLGYFPEEFPTNCDLWMEKIHSEDRQLVKRRLKTCIEHACQGFSIEFRMATKDGAWKWILCRGKSVRKDPNGHAARLVGTNIDVTAQHTADEKIRESELMYRQLFDLESDAILLIEKETGRILEANKAALGMYGYTHEEILGIGIEDISETPEQNLHRNTIGPKKYDPQHHTRKDGVVIPVETSEREFQMNGKNVQLIAIREISARLQAEKEKKDLLEQLHQAQKIEAVGTLAGGMAHDFNNILTVIFGYCHILSHRNDVSAPAKKLVNEIIKAGNRASDLTQGLLTFSRKQVMIPIHVELKEILEEFEGMLRQLVRADISFSLSTCDHETAIVADRGQIGQVLINLVSNAVDAMPQGGRLAISCSRSTITGYPSTTTSEKIPAGVYAVITVEDTGEGIDSETMKRMFEPFFTTKEYGKGTGLGMAIVHGIVKQHNGFITIQSTPGKGTMIKLLFPISREAELCGDGCNGAENADPAGSETILIAEDDMAIRTLNTLTMEQAGYTVICAEDGEDAVSKFVEHQEKIDLLLLDVVMPRIDGKAAYDLIRTIKPGIKVIFTSGYTKDMILIKGVFPGDVSFIHKPFHPNDILRLIRNVLDEEKSKGP